MTQAKKKANLLGFGYFSDRNDDQNWRNFAYSGKFDGLKSIKIPDEPFTSSKKATLIIKKILDDRTISRVT